VHERERSDAEERVATQRQRHVAHVQDQPLHLVDELRLAAVEDIQELCTARRHQ
jgi:hypothetical protein